MTVNLPRPIYNDETETDETTNPYLDDITDVVPCDDYADYGGGEVFF